MSKQPPQPPFAFRPLQRLAVALRIHPVLIMLAGVSAAWRDTAAQPGLDYEPRTVLSRPMRAITDPPVVAAEAARLTDMELVIGVVVNGQPRAYPINQLTGPRREIINDVLAGTAIAATW